MFFKPEDHFLTIYDKPDLSGPLIAVNKFLILSVAHEPELGSVEITVGKETYIGYVEDDFLKKINLI